MAFVVFLYAVMMACEARGQMPGGRGADTSKTSTPADSAKPSNVPQAGARQYETNAALAPMRMLRETIRRDSALLRAYMDSLAITPLALMHRNLALNPREWMPTAADTRRRDDDIKQSQSWDQIHQNIPRVGASVSLQDIGRVLGLIEDVTPRIKYTLTRTDSITVKVYDLTSRNIRVIVNGVQSPGVYSFDWDLQDNDGQRVVAGDYIAEVIVARRLVVRKRIEVP